MQIDEGPFAPHFITRFRFWGIRALNWSEKSLQELLPQIYHADNVGCAPWLFPGRINIIIGPNGGGKTTVLDLIRALRCPKLWPSLPRDNAPGDVFSGFLFEGGDWALRAEFRASPTQNATKASQERLLSIVPGQEHEPHHRSRKAKMPLGRATSSSLKEAAPRWKETVEETIEAAKIPAIEYCEPAGNWPERDTPDLLDILNEFWSSLHGIARVEIPGVDVNIPPFGLDEDAADNVHLVLSDDRGQPSVLRLEYLPLGWRQFAYVISFMRRAAQKSIVVLDEPDRVLHPRLQRLLLDEVAKIARERKQQVFLSTHSPSLINPSVTEALNAVVFRAVGTRVSLLEDRRDVLDDLGVSSADLAQANGVIWVEGPSDRIYINRWIQLYAHNKGFAPWIEGINYQVAFYGGALLKYLTLEDQDQEGSDLVSIRALNRKFFIVMDRDKDSFDETVGEKQTSKHRLFDEARALAGEKGSTSVLSPLVWITEGYTIEDYLPTSFQKWIKKVDGKTEIVGRKIVLADRFRSAQLLWPQSFLVPSDLPTSIERLFREIAKWQITSSEPDLYKASPRDV
ncbi:ATP-dependent nuclease (plasmid) [Rhizobium leguminosarum]